MAYIIAYFGFDAVLLLSLILLTVGWLIAVRGAERLSDHPRARFWLSSAIFIGFIEVAIIILNVALYNAWNFKGLVTPLIFLGLVEIPIIICGMAIRYLNWNQSVIVSTLITIISGLVFFICNKAFGNWLITTLTVAGGALFLMLIKVRRHYNGRHLLYFIWFISMIGVFSYIEHILWYFIGDSLWVCFFVCGMRSTIILSLLNYTVKIKNSVINYEK